MKKPDASVADFIRYAKETFGLAVKTVPSKTPDTYEQIFEQKKERRPL